LHQDGNGQQPDPGESEQHPIRVLRSVGNGEEEKSEARAGCTGKGVQADAKGANLRGEFLSEDDNRETSNCHYADAGDALRQGEGDRLRSKRG